MRSTSFAEVVRAFGLNDDTVRKYAEDAGSIVLRLLEDIEYDVIEAMIAEVMKAPPTAEAKLGAFIETLTKAQPSRINRLVLLALVGSEFAGHDGHCNASHAAIRPFLPHH